MQWQDIVIMVGTIIFIIALIPSITSKDKPAFSTSVLTAGALLFFAIAYFTLALWFAAITTAVLVFMWLTLAIQKLNSSKNAK